MDYFRIFVGYDKKEDIAFEVCKHSILSRASIKVEVIPIKQNELRDWEIYTRPIDNLSSTEFTFTRFFTPYLSGFSGKAVFCDCDFLWNCDAKEILDLFDDKYAVQVVKHNYIPKEQSKGTGAQYNYPKKNWSSMVLWNCEAPSNMVLTPQFLNQANASTLHQFKWLRDEEIGEISHEYNWLENWYKEPKDGKPKIIHYTRGGVWFKEWQHVDYAEEWKKEYEDMTDIKWTDDMILSENS